MQSSLNAQNWAGLGVSPDSANEIISKTESLLKELPPDQVWKRVSKDLVASQLPFEVHREVYDHVFSDWNPEKGPRPAWAPSQEEAQSTNLFRAMKEGEHSDYSSFFEWSVSNREEFWKKTIERIGIGFKTTPERVLDNSAGPEKPSWLKNARLNIADSCFLADRNQTAIVFQREGGQLEELTYGDLEKLTNRVANGLLEKGFKEGDRIAIDMTMTVESVAIYLGLIKAGLVAISIADSFAADEIASRLRIADAKGVFTQDQILRGGKKLPMYQKIKDASAPRAIVLPCEGEVSEPLRDGDLAWKDFLSSNESFESVPRNPEDETNILFSSGTTGDPKAIPWTHLTPIKCAGDGYYHHDIQNHDVVAWPTNLGWMMGPWLIYASLLNRATMALYYGLPTGGEFGEFVQNSKISVLGLVPSLVKAWRNSGCMEKLDWSGIKAFSSTGECSNADDYFYLMYLAGYRPVIEYCGGTEIGGGYITGTLVQAASPSTFSTPALGLDLCILGEDGKPDPEGEVFIIPPSIGLSSRLLNRDHHEVYFKGTPKGPHDELLRRHGDQLHKLAKGYFSAQGRADDTMNLGGIKVSSAEIERVLNRLDDVLETAAIAVNPPGGGPSQLVIYTVLNEAGKTPEDLSSQMQTKIKTDLNPLFRIHDVKVIDKLPRTASNKVMRRELRASYQKEA